MDDRSSTTQQIYSNPIPFSFFSDLVDQISRCTAKAKNSSTSTQPSKQIKLVKRWIDKVKATHAPGLDDPLPDGTIVIFFRLLFPEEGVRRRYGLQEYTLGKELEKLYRVGEGKFANWSAPCEGGRAVATGCLGDTVKLWMERKGKCRAGDETLTFGTVDMLLDELAATSEYSAKDVRDLRALPSYRSRPVSSILYDLLRPLNPAQTSLMIQLILRDISPILYPPPSTSGTVALTNHNSTCYDRVDLVRVIGAWDHRMSMIYRSVADLDWVAKTVESWMRSGVQGLPSLSPVVGLPIKVPKSERPGTCARATKHLSGKVAAETKYDGERLQIHVDLSLPRHQQIKIFSKSGRDSTETRHLLHPTIRAALGLDIGDRFASNQHLLLASRLHSARRASPQPRSTPPTKLVLEGEMVPYNEDTRAIDEFWKLSFVKSDLTIPNDPTYTNRRVERDTPETGESGEIPTPRQNNARTQKSNNLHLKIVWFDVLVVGDEDLCDLSYSERRARLEQLVQPIPGFSMFAERVIIDFGHPPSALKNLRLHFAKIITDRCEGFMLKPITSKYNDYRPGQKWVKLKKDFIPGAGDTLDFVIVGASWQKQRARELLVPTSVYTTFFVGLEAEALGAPLNRANKKHYHVLFSTSYGLNRQQLDELVHSIRQSRPQPFNPSKLAEGTFRKVPGARGRYTVYESACTTFTFSLADHLYSNSTRPTIIFPEPREVELNGAGFQQTPGCPYYELRWPRITKSSRIDAQPLSLSALQRTAREAMQLHPEPTESQVIADLFNWSKTTTASPARSKKESEKEKYDREWRDWVRRLEEADGIFGDDTALPLALDWEETTHIEPELPLSPPRPTELRPHTNLAPNRVLATPPRRSRTLNEVALEQPRTSPASKPRNDLRQLPLSASSPNLKLTVPAKRRLILDEAASEGGRPRSRPRTIDSERRRISCPLPLPRTSSTPLLSSLVNQLLTPPSSSPEAPVCDSPFSKHSWSFFPSLPSTSPLVTPMHPFLDSTNYLSTPMSVLWAAGILPSMREPVKKRQGWIFVAQGHEEEAIEWARRHVQGEGERVGGGGSETVWLIGEEALKTRSLGHLEGNEILSIL
ncbi:uncharacterized protein JCM6883_001943 [Sporobolomyces salmoneus]|uniref:uncharacterized protein n=1 Tax=Sporobolomyces salmoneus TaxID=183962 RepID=UPI0031769819